jgi:membrane protease YdiL (CAAX protease family)
MSQDRDRIATVVQRPATVAPLSFWATLLWGLLALAAWVASQFIVMAIYIAIWASLHSEALPDVDQLARDGALLALGMLAAVPAYVAVLAYAVRRRGGRFKDYVALVSPRRSEVGVGIFCITVLMMLVIGSTWLSGRDLVPPFLVQVYSSAREANAIVLLSLTLVAAVPIGEEIAFRGFLFRGWAAARPGPVGAIALTALCWTILHFQHDWFFILQVFVVGLVLGFLRWSSGSTTLTIILHGIMNLVELLQVAFKVELMAQ